MPSPSLESLESAARIVHSVLPPTPQISWPILSRQLGAEVWIKHENHTSVGAFKIRGGLVHFDELTRTQPGTRGVVAATRGNHGQSVAFAARRHGLKAIIVVPFGNSVEKNAAMQALGADLVEHGEDFQAAYEYAATVAQAKGYHMVPAMSEGIIRGVASASLELFQAVKNLDTFYVPIGMGSGICAAIAVRDALKLKTEIVGVVASAAPAYALSFAQRRVVSAPVTPTIADGMACRLPLANAVEIITQGAARIVSVSDAEVRRAMRDLFAHTHNVAEGAGAAAWAAAVQEKSRHAGKRVAAILTGGNVDTPLYAGVLAGQ